MYLHDTFCFVIASSEPGFARPARMKRAVFTSPAGRGQIALAIRVRGFAPSMDRKPSPGASRRPLPSGEVKNQRHLPQSKINALICCFCLALLGEAIQRGVAKEAGWLRREGLLAMTGLRFQIFFRTGRIASVWQPTDGSGLESIALPGVMRDGFRARMSNAREARRTRAPERRPSNPNTRWAHHRPAHLRGPMVLPTLL